jgi:hypothetical protein
MRCDSVCTTASPRSTGMVALHTAIEITMSDANACCKSVLGIARVVF